MEVEVVVVEVALAATVVASMHFGPVIVAIAAKAFS